MRTLHRLRLVLGFTAALAVLLLNGLASAWSVQRLIEHDRRVAHTHEVLTHLESVMSTVQDADIGFRGYLLTGQDVFRKAEAEAVARLPQEVDHLQALTADNLEQQGRITALREQVRRKFALHDELIALYQQGRPQDALAVLRGGEGKRRLDAVRALIDEMQAEEDRLLAVRADEARDSGRLVLLTVGGATVLAIGALVVVGLMARREIRERQAHADRVRHEHELFRVTLASIGDAVLVTDGRGAVTYLNPGAEALTGWPRADAVGRPLADVLRLTAADGPAGAANVARRDGRRVPVETVAAPLRDARGNVVGDVLALHDVTERRRAEQEIRTLNESLERRVAERTGQLEAANAELERARAAAEAASRAKSEFLANMSHEIRTPMNGILGMIRLALDTPLTAEQRDYLSVVRASADGLLAIIDDILDFSKIEAGKLALDPTPFPLRDSLADLLQPLALRAQKKGLELALSVAPDVPDAVVADLGRLRQVALNLVGNALKFTEHGEIVVAVALAADPAPVLPPDGCRLHVTVRDTGIGIPPDKLRAIFEPFTQADGSTTRRYGGTGLGLSICQRLTELMGGRLWAESAVGRGSTFHVTVAVRRAADAGPGPAGLPVLDGVRTLVVDDNATSRQVLREMLAGWRLAPVAVAGPADALAELARAADLGAAYPLLLLDTTLPYDAAAQLLADVQARPVLAATRVILLASADRAADPRWPDLGVRGVVVKPPRRSHLLETIQRALAGEAPAVPMPPPAGGRPVRPLRILLAEDEPVNQRVASLLLGRQGHAVTVVGTGRAALDALAAGAFDLVLMDVQMPELDGLSATRELRAREVSRRTPVIALTAHAMTGDRERCLAAGCDGYVRKPLHPEELWQAIADLIPAAAPVAAAVPAVGEPPVFNQDELLDRLGGSAALLDEIVELFRTEGQRIMAELDEAAAAADLDRLRRAAHTLRGTLGYVSAAPAAAAAGGLEHAAMAGDATAAAAAYRRLRAEYDRLGRALPAPADAARR